MNREEATHRHARPRQAAGRVGRLLSLVFVVLAATMLTTTPASGDMATLHYAYHGGDRWPVDQMARAWSANGDIKFRETRWCHDKQRCVDIWVGEGRQGEVAITGYIFTPNPQIVLNRDYRHRPRALRRQAVCHELGHVLGLMHRRKSCMAPYTGGPYTRPTERDLEQVRKLW